MGIILLIPGIVSIFLLRKTRQEKFADSERATTKGLAGSERERMKRFNDAERDAEREEERRKKEEK